MEIFYFFLFMFKQPNQQDVINFIERDKTNLIQYTEDFDCKDFSETLVKNAVGFDAYPVGVGWSGDNGITFHMFVAFETSDGIVWVEPQNDRIYTTSKEFLCYEDGECVSDNLLFVFDYH